MGRPEGVIRIGVAGCTGRMGVQLIQAVRQDGACTLSAGGVRAGNQTAAQQTLQALGVGSPLELVDNPKTLFEISDAVIDFTSPELTLDMAALAAASGKAQIIGTTGFTPAQEQQLRSYSDRARIVWSANMSMCVNILEQLVKQVASLLDEQFDIEIVEMHHRLKKDAPSGTALMLGRAAAQGRGVDLEAKRVSSRDGMTGEREAGSIGIMALRGGDVVGDHTVIFAGPGERLELTHKSSSREIYARGAVRAAKWAIAQKPGFYSMGDVLFGA